MPLWPDGLGEENKMADQRQNELQQIADQIANERETDTLIYIGGVNISSARNLVDLVGRRNRRRNLLFVLGTTGGDAHAAYKISRCLQHAYEEGEFSVAIYGDCKSAGTLIAMAAKKIIMDQHGELGPLDVQLHKEDQLFEHTSGLTPKQALASLREQSLSHFEEIMLAVHTRSGFQISTRLAASIGIRMAVGLLGPIYAQIDPMRIGETQRSMNIARAYGERLNVHSNLRMGALDKLIEGYPSHDFAIDFDEAKGLFNTLVRPDDLQKQLGSQLVHLLLPYRFISQDDATVAFINTETSRQEITQNTDNADKSRSSHAKKAANTAAGKGEPIAEAVDGRVAATAAGDGESGKRATHKTSRNGKASTLPTPNTTGVGMT